MANMYEGFVAEFRLVDLDGIVLASPGDHIVINEPEDFNKSMIKLKRSKNHGLDYEFSDPETPFKLDQVVHDDEKGVSDHSPYTFVQALYDIDGVDAKCHLEYRHLGVTPEIQYQGRLSMKFGINDDVNSMTSKRINLDDLMRTRINTKVNFAATVSIDGTAVTGLSSESMFLHSKKITTSFFADAVPLAPPGSTTSVAAANQTVYTDVAYENITVNGIKDFNDNFLSLEDEPIPTFEVAGGGTMVINQISVSKLLSLGNVGNVAVEIFYRVNDSPEVSIGGLVNLVGVFANTLYQHTFNNVSIPVPIREAREKNKIYIYIKVVFAGAAGTFTLKDGTLIVALPVTVKLDQLDADMFEVESNSFAEVYNTFNAFNHILEVINNGTNLLISDFWSTLGSDIYKTNGYKIRAFTTRNVIASFDQMFDKWAKPCFGLGFAIVEDSGVSKVLMERYSHFYQDKEIMTIDSIEEGSWNLRFDKDVFFNEALIGYKEYPKSTDENKNDNIDEFLTAQELLFPLETIRNKAVIVSDSIASGYLLENQRREQFKDIPQDTVSYDENLFCIKGLTSDSYTDFTMWISGISTIDINGNFMNLVVGEVITISGTANNNGNFTIQTIDTDLTGNPNFSFGMRLTVAEATILESTAAGTITKASAFLRAERIEAMAIRAGVSDIQTVYNMGLNIKNMLMNQSPILNSGFNKKPGTALIKTQEAFLNGSMRSKFAVGEGGYVLDPDKNDIIQDEDLMLSEINQNQKLHTGFIFSFKARLDYSAEILRIRDANLNQSAEDINYGYLRVLGDDGIFHKGHLLEMDYNPLAEWTTFLCREFFE